MTTLQLSKYKKICIISPHFDDAALSCGGLMLRLGQKANMVVVNVFTKAHKGPYTISAKKFLKDAGYKDAVDMFAARQKEDKAALSGIKVRVINLGLQDALFRRKNKVSVLGKILPEIDHIYPTYRWHVVKGANQDVATKKALKGMLTKFVNKDVIVVAPYGIGGHVDHRIARSVCEELFTDLILYSDFPYNIRTKDYGRAPKNYTKVELSVDLNKKEELLKMYRTQFRGLFQGEKMPPHKEVFFVKVKR